LEGILAYEFISSCKSKELIDNNRVHGQKNSMRLWLRSNDESSGFQPNQFPTNGSIADYTHYYYWNMCKLNFITVGIDQLRSLIKR
jgi:hypothetical protein